MNVDSFVAYAKKYVNTNLFVIDAQNQQYKDMTGPIDNVMNMADVMTVSTIIAGCLITVLLILLMLRGRRYEFGVLLSIGEKS